MKPGAAARLPGACTVGKTLLFSCLHNLHQTLYTGVVLCLGEIAGIRLVSVEAGDRNVASLADLAAHLRHKTAPEFAAAIGVYQKTLDLVVLCQLDTFVTRILEIDRIRNLAISTAHIVEVFVNSA